MKAPFTALKYVMGAFTALKYMKVAFTEHC